MEVRPPAPRNEWSKISKTVCPKFQKSEFALLSEGLSWDEVLSLGRRSRIWFPAPDIVPCLPLSNPVTLFKVESFKVANLESHKFRSQISAPDIVRLLLPPSLLLFKASAESFFEACELGFQNIDVTSTYFQQNTDVYIDFAKGIWISKNN